MWLSIREENSATASQFARLSIIRSTIVLGSSVPSTRMTSSRSLFQLGHTKSVWWASSTASPQWWHFSESSFLILHKYFPKQPWPLRDWVRWKSGGHASCCTTMVRPLWRTSSPSPWFQWLAELPTVRTSSGATLWDYLLCDCLHQRRMAVIRPPSVASRYKFSHQQGGRYEVRQRWYLPLRRKQCGRRGLG